ncbi:MULTISPECIES: hypothetical protein [unclassified Microbacterium]|uniref:hypothetical protein n=1 Tax=unclassified Microbacterium TaxID=2609290 RepID=UPI001DE90129|nr:MULTISPECIES: hypothetical protein [unclassified Microbacterium]CAH0170956.1 hypothetical protein SRABI121_01749 [Microbacterium sp. Bi121]HWK77926.1 hypothetical protein [Microbacterium sp.]
MDRTIVVAMPAPIPHGHRVEVVERVDENGERSVLAVTDLETRIRYEHSRSAVSGAATWVGRVLECAVNPSRAGFSTTLLVDPVGPGAAEADVALRGADAAASAVTDEALRWGGADRKPEPEAPRFW